MGWGNVNISNGSFVNCSTVNGNGGAIYITGGNISDCSFVNCSTVNGNGGAIYINQTEPHRLITNCTFINNNPNDIAEYKIFSTVKIIGNTTYLYSESPEFIFEIVDDSGNIFNDATGMLNIEIVDYYWSYADVNNGKATMTLSPIFNPGTYELRASYTGDEKYYSSENSLIFNVIEDTLE